MLTKAELDAPAHLQYEPIGMTGQRLEAEVYLVTVLSSAVQNLRRCVEKAGYHVGEFVLEPLAALHRMVVQRVQVFGDPVAQLARGRHDVHSTCAPGGPIGNQAPLEATPKDVPWGVSRSSAISTSS